MRVLNKLETFGGVDLGVGNTYAKFEARRGPFPTHSHPPQKSMPAPAYLRPSSAGNRDFSVPSTLLFLTLRHELPAERADPGQPERDPTANEQQATDHTDQHDPKVTTEHLNNDGRLHGYTQNTLNGDHRSTGSRPRTPPTSTTRRGPPSN